MPTDLVPLIKDIPISQVLGHYIVLKSKGANYTALCPFHGDTNPSLHISEKRGLFKCFSCGVGGDAITFVQKYKNLPFRESLMEIAIKFNLPMDDFKSPQSVNPKYAMGLKMNKSVVRMFRQCAQSDNSGEFEKFLKKRKITKKIATQFALGYAPKNNVLSHYLATLEGPEKQQALAQEIGLIRPDRNRPGEFYDTFRDRIIFPIWDQYDNVVGFGSRAVFDYQKGKYINSQESFLFNKKNILYGLNFAKQSVREQSQVLLVEGYMDCLALVQKGRPNTVALMGVGMTSAMVKKMAHMASDIVLGFDSDTAGFQAAKKINELFLREGLLPRYLDYHPHKDPDEFLHHQSRIELMEKIANAPTFLDLLMGQELGETIPQSTDRKLAKLQNIFTLARPLKKTLPATERIIEGAKKLGLKSTHEQILQSYQDYLSKEKTSSPPKSPPPPIKEALLDESAPALSPETPSRNSAPRPSKSDCIILENLAAHPECFKSKDYESLLEYRSCSEVKQLVELLENVYFEVNEGHYPKMVQANLKGEKAGPFMTSVVGGLLRYVPHELDQEKVDKLMGDLKKKLKRESLMEQRGRLKNQQETCETDQEGYELLKKINIIQQELNELKR